MSWWWLLVLLLLICLLICVLCAICVCVRYRGANYAVFEKERDQGREPMLQPDDKRFVEYGHGWVHICTRHMQYDIDAVNEPHWVSPIVPSSTSGMTPPLVSILYYCIVLHCVHRSMHTKQTVCSVNTDAAHRRKAEYTLNIRIVPLISNIFLSHHILWANEWLSCLCLLSIILCIVRACSNIL